MSEVPLYRRDGLDECELSGVIKLPRMPSGSRDRLFAGSFEREGGFLS